MDLSVPGAHARRTYCPNRARGHLHRGARPPGDRVTYLDDLAVRIRDQVPEARRGDGARTVPVVRPPRPRERWGGRAERRPQCLGRMDARVPFIAWHERLPRGPTSVPAAVSSVGMMMARSQSSPAALAGVAAGRRDRSASGGVVAEDSTPARHGPAERTTRRFPRSRLSTRAALQPTSPNYRFGWPPPPDPRCFRDWRDHFREST